MIIHKCQSIIYKFQLSYYFHWHANLKIKDVTAKAYPDKIDNGAFTFSLNLF
jgi:hypothetical protein